MDIFIDNKRHKVPKNIGFSGAMDEINRVLKKQDKILQNLYVNGKEIIENSILKGQNVKLIEVSTRSNRGVIMQSLGMLEENIDNYFDNLDEILNSESTMVEYEKLDEILIFVAWTYGILIALKENTAIDLIYDDYDDFIFEFKKAFEEANQALEAEDTVQLFDILDYDLGSLMSGIEDNIRVYYEQAEKEELRKDIIN
ncbi:hypothetical protein SAMN02745174_00706 [Cetobacterium ceti]|uniref:Uncharacterized protein n=1 Tax=Cetobacterium ceti TaxID=180163 RepID=A0A1T4L0T5_9FUSO|nr:hypothetical protein [Cetobacterium ceti]SJZ48309.1 hypothetical protein SAMN02745174_00706 [Cetobacterium ceti]